MSLSETSYEILSDLLELRLESFLVNSTEEARELKMLKGCQRELEMLRGIGEKLSLERAVEISKQTVPSSKLPRRLQRLIAAEAAARQTG